MSARFVETGHRSATVRRANLSVIMRELHRSGGSSRSDLVDHAGLTRSAVRDLGGELASLGLAREERAVSRGRPGRPSAWGRPEPTGAVVLALEIAVDSLAVAAVGLGGQVSDEVRAERRRGRVSFDQTVEDLTALARAVRDRMPERDTLIGIGVAVAGIVRRSDGFVRLAPNLGWTDVPLGVRVAEAMTPGPTVSVANEADLGALAELWRGAAVHKRDVLFISGEVGVGGGLIVDGRPLMGTSGYGGEVGHIPVNPAGVACRCGSFGCWETEVGEGMLLTRAGRSPGGGREAVDAVLEEAAAGSPAAIAALEEVGRWLGVGLAGLVNVFDPELVVLGGRLERIYPFVITALRNELERRALPVSRQLVSIVPARLGGNAALLGAAELAFEPLLSDPAARAPRRGDAARPAAA